MAKASQVIVKWGKHSQYQFTYGDLWIVLAMFGFSVALGGIVYGAGESRRNKSNPASIFDSFCSVANFVHPTVCPPDYPRTFHETCQAAVTNGTTKFYDALTGTATIKDGLPEMNQGDVDIMSKLCAFPQPLSHDQYPNCVSTHILLCFNNMWASLATLYRENSDTQNEHAVAKTSAITSSLLVGLLLTSMVLGWRIWTRSKTAREEPEGFYTSAPGNF